MALIDKASLLFVPSVVAEGKVFNILPSGNRAPDSTDQNSGYDQTRADFDFDRGSNAAATRIGSDGLLKKYRENLALHSNSFDNWTNYLTNETSGQADKDGGTNAWLLEKTAAGASIYRTPSPSGVATFSVYLKSGTLNWVRLDYTGGGSKGYFDLKNGVLGSVVGGPIDTKIENVGGGWYRCSITTTSTGSGVGIVPAESDGSVSGTSGNILIQNAQLESGLVATEYLESTSVTGKAGVLVDLPRINFDANGENGALLLEPSRQQLLQYSEYFDGWTGNGASITTNSTTSPEGVQNASTITGVSGNNRIYLLETTTSGTTYTLSFYAKKGTSSTIGLDFINVSSGTTFNFDTKSWGTNAAWDLFDYEELDNGWFRLYGVIDSNTTSAGIGIYVESGETAYIFGAQLEAGSYPSSYIPNHGESGGVTRAADSCTTDDLQTLNVFNGSQGAVLFEGVKNGETIFSNFVVTANSNTNKSLLVDNSSGTIRLRVWNASSGQDATISTSSVDDGTFKYLIKWNAGSLAVYFNGSSVGTDTITAYSYTNVNLKEGTFSNNYIKQFTLFDEVPTDAECVTLTTL